jgi:hypothetical protein
MPLQALSYQALPHPEQDGEFEWLKINSLFVVHREQR